MSMTSIAGTREALFVPASKQESPANAKRTRDSSACMKAHCEQM